MHHWSHEQAVCIQLGSASRKVYPTLLDADLSRYYRIQSTSEQYVSYWNAFLLRLVVAKAIHVTFLGTYNFGLKILVLLKVVFRPKFLVIFFHAIRKILFMQDKNWPFIRNRKLNIPVWVKMTFVGHLWSDIKLLAILDDSHYHISQKDRSTCI